MTKYRYGWESLHSAVRTLAGASDQKQRLETAIISNLIPITPESDLPPAIRKDFIAFMSEMRSQRTHESEGAVWGVINLLDESGRQRAVTRIIDFYDVVSRDIGRNEHLNS